MLFCRQLILFFKIKFFEKKIQKYHQSHKTWILIRPDIMSGLIWVQTACKGYEQTTLVGRVRTISISISSEYVSVKIDDVIIPFEILD